jgi:4-amino-4-deoxy-L-arabinose transferase-like glycosyltransferase
VERSSRLALDIAVRERADRAAYPTYALVLVALFAAWCMGMFARGYWTPDEPREADVSWRMSWQADRVIPTLAAAPIVEKPPLAYWVAGASIAVFGPTPWATRLPNLLYALVTVVAVGLLARTLFGASAEIPAMVFAGTFAMAFQVAIWLTTDAPLVAAVAIALLGAARGFTARDTTSRLCGYGLFHVGLAAAFLAKGPAGWLVPILALGGTIAFERRWRELLRWELWAPAVLPVAACASWTLAVASRPDGPELLRVAYWYNLVGRAVTVASPADADYSTHRNWPGKYLLELPLYVFPWIGVLVVATWHAWRDRAAAGAAQRTARRFAVAAIVLPLALLSFASTARGVYAGQLLPGFALFFAGWCVSPSARGVGARRALRAAVICAALLGLVLLAAWFLFTPSGQQSMRDLTRALLAGVGCALGAVLLGAAWVEASRAPAARVVVLVGVGTCALLAGPGFAAFRAIQPTMDFAHLAAVIRTTVGDAPLVLWRADETTRGFVDLYVRRDPEVVNDWDADSKHERVGDRLAAHPGLLALVMFPGRSAGPLETHLPAKWRRPLPPPPAEVVNDPRVRIVREIDVAGGRRYAVLTAARPRVD